MELYSLSPHAESDLDEIWDYFAQFDADNANRFLLEVFEIFGMLARNPLAGRVRNEIRENLRSFPKGDYAIFYYTNVVSVRIIRVLHSARNIEKVIDEEM